MSTVFSYKPLHGAEIRLLSIEKAEFDQPLRISIEHVPLGSSPKYMALSYVWGDPEDTVMAEVDGMEFAITRNLFQALRQERKSIFQGDEELHTLRIWADAICIDQGNEAEKSTQVLRMAEIYQSASLVVGWLGTAEDLDPRVVKLIFDFANMLFYKHFAEVEEGADQGELEENLRASLPRLQSSLGEVFDIFVETLLKIVQRAFFTRVWIVQEAVLAYAYPIPLMIDDFWTRGLLHLWLAMTGSPILHQKFIRHQGLVAFDRIREFRDARRSQWGAENDESLAGFAKRLDQVLSLSGQGRFKATKAHDYVYGLLSVAGAPKELPQELAPDYSCPYWTVYWAYSKFLIQHTESLLILSNPGNSIMNPRPVVKDEGIPSWVPDLRHPSHTYHAPDVKAIVSFSADGKCMSVKGISLGPALHVIQPQRPDRPFFPADYRAGNIRHRILDKAAGLRGRSRNHIYQLWLSSFPAHETYKLPLDDVGRIFSTIEEDPYESRYRKVLEEESQWEEAMFRIKEEIEASMFHHAQFVTAQGYVGSLMCTAECVEEEDIVCMFYGMTSGVLLRPSGSNFTFVGVVQWRCSMGKKKFDDRFFAKHEVRTFHLI